MDTSSPSKPAGSEVAALRARAVRFLERRDRLRIAETLPWGTPKEVAERIIVQADQAGANTVQISLNRGAMPQEMFLEQIRRFARDVLPVLQAHEVKVAPVAAAAAD